MKTKVMTLAAVVVMMFASAWAADMSAAETSALQPPKGRRIALVAFEDLECQACAKAEPLLMQAERNYGLPLVRHDFVIPVHVWSEEAHIMARWFDAQSPELGEEFRHYIFTNQNAIYKTNLREWAEKFGRTQGHPLPVTFDPALRSKVEADKQLGIALGVHGTPTIFVVTNSPKVQFVQVMDTEKLFETIDKVNEELKNEPQPAPTKKK
jgi:protein-disulfide isomerase